MNCDEVGNERTVASAILGLLIGTFWTLTLNAAISMGARWSQRWTIAMVITRPPIYLIWYVWFLVSFVNAALYAAIAIIVIALLSRWRTFAV